MKATVIKEITWKWYSFLLSHLSSYVDSASCFYYIVFKYKKNTHTKRLCMSFVGKHGEKIQPMIMAIDFVILILDECITCSTTFRHVLAIASMLCFYIQIYFVFLCLFQNVWQFGIWLGDYTLQYWCRLVE